MSAIAQIIEGVIEGDGETQITSVAPPKAAEEGCLVFVLSREGAELAAASEASAVVAQPGFDFPGKIVIRVDNPRYALALGLTAAKAFGERPQSGVHATAVVAEGANLADGVAIGPLVHVADEVDIGRGTIIDPGCVIERNVRIGPGCRLHANVTICHGTRIGARVEIHPGTVIGSDGFGYIQKSAAPTDDRSFARYFQKEEPHFKVPQMGNVVIDDDVEIGANVTVDRGTIDATVIGKGVKIDNLVQIGHNVVIEDHVLIASQAGISGHTQISTHATVGGQAGIGEGVVVGDGALISAKCGLPTGKHVPPRTAFAGAIGRPAEKNLKISGALAVLPKTTARLRALEKEVLALRESIARQGGASRTEP